MTEASGASQGRARTSDQLELAWRSWTPELPRGVVIIVHGLAEHGGRYHDTARTLSTNGWAVYACDLRAHGLSPDPPGAGRVHVHRFRDYFRDVEAMAQLARHRHPGLPVFILGHSMGGLIAISYALEKPENLAGVVISSPALGTHPKFQPPFLLKMLVGILSRLTPHLLVDSNLDTRAICRDPEVVKAYIDDPLVSHRVSTRWYSEITKAMKQAFRNAGSLRLPMLLMQSGADRLVDPAAPGRWVRAAPPGLVELVIWEDLYHEMLNEPEKDKVRAKLLDWLNSATAR